MAVEEISDEEGAGRNDAAIALFQGQLANLAAVFPFPAAAQGPGIQQEVMGQMHHHQGYQGLTQPHVTFAFPWTAQGGGAQPESQVAAGNPPTTCMQASNSLSPGRRSRPTGYQPYSDPRERSGSQRRQLDDLDLTEPIPDERSNNSQSPEQQQQRLSRQVVEVDAVAAADAATLVAETLEDGHQPSAQE